MDIFALLTSGSANVDSGKTISLIVTVEVQTIWLQKSWKVSPIIFHLTSTASEQYYTNLSLAFLLITSMEATMKKYR